jgi:hypothetical protein
VSKPLSGHVHTKFFPLLRCWELTPEVYRSNLNTTYIHRDRSKIRFTEIVKLTLITFTCE